MVDLKQVSTYVFKTRQFYTTLTKEDKEYIFFIFNRFVSKKYPRHAQYFNSKFIAKDQAMDLLFLYFKSSFDIPKWWWTRQKTIEKNPIQDQYHLYNDDIIILQKYFNEDYEAALFEWNFYNDTDFQNKALKEMSDEPIKPKKTVIKKKAP